MEITFTATLDCRHTITADPAYVETRSFRHLQTQSDALAIQHTMEIDFPANFRGMESRTCFGPRLDGASFSALSCRSVPIVRGQQIATRRLVVGKRRALAVSFTLRLEEHWSSCTIAVAKVLQTRLPLTMHVRRTSAKSHRLASRRSSSPYLNRRANSSLLLRPPSYRSLGCLRFVEPVGLSVDANTIKQAPANIEGCDDEVSSVLPSNCYAH